MKKKDWNEGLNYIDSDLVEEFVLKSVDIENRKRNKSIWLRFGIIAVCICLIFSAVVVTPMLREDSPKDNHEVPTWDTAMYSAQDIAELFNSYKIESYGTNAYQEIYVPDSKYLYIGKIPDSEYLGIYQSNTKVKSLDKKEFCGFIDSFLSKLSDSLDCDVPSYEIKEDSFSVGGEFLRADGDMGEYSIIINQNQIDNSVSVYSRSDDRKIVLDNETVQIDQRLTDDEIIESLEGIKNKLFDIFGVSFTDVKVSRSYSSYSEYGVQRMSVYFYNKDTHPLNSQKGMLVSDNISISFDNFANYAGDIVSDTILSVADIRYEQNRIDASQAFKLVANAKKISVSDAEALLYNGYVFGGHSCPLCMAMQDKVSFDGYDFVGVEYMFGYDYNTNLQTTGIPFYAFYKQIGTSKNGNIVYAKTYVPAIEVSGYKEYFENQTEDHRNNTEFEQ